jgi:hypothetical protein
MLAMTSARAQSVQKIVAWPTVVRSGRAHSIIAPWVASRERLVAASTCCRVSFDIVGPAPNRTG